MSDARFAYVFDPASEPGISGLERTLRPGGTACIVDNDLRSGTFARWLRDAHGETWFNPDRLKTFWQEHRFTDDCLTSSWRFENRDVLERVVHLEFPKQDAARFLGCHSDLEIDYNLQLIHRTLGS